MSKVTTKRGRPNKREVKEGAPMRSKKPRVDDTNEDINNNCEKDLDHEVCAPISETMKEPEPHSSTTVLAGHQTSKNYDLAKSSQAGIVDDFLKVGDEQGEQNPSVVPVHTNRARGSKGDKRQNSIDNGTPHKKKKETKAKEKEEAKRERVKEIQKKQSERKEETEKKRKENFEKKEETRINQTEKTVKEKKQIENKADSDEGGNSKSRKTDDFNSLTPNAPPDLKSALVKIPVQILQERCISYVPAAVDATSARSQLIYMIKSHQAQPKNAEMVPTDRAHADGASNSRRNKEPEPQSSTRPCPVSLEMVPTERAHADGASSMGNDEQQNSNDFL